MEITSSNSLISFGQQIEQYKSTDRGGTDDEIVLTKELLNTAYPMKLSITATYKGQQVQAEQNLYYHYCQNLHTNYTPEQYNTWSTEHQEEINNEERIFFVSEKKEGD